MKEKTLQQSVDAACAKLIRQSSEGARFKDLQLWVRKTIPDINANTLRGALHRFGQRLPDDIIHPVRGFYISQDAWNQRDKSKAIPTRAHKNRNPT